MAKSTASVAERFLSRVDKNGPLPEHRPDLGPCWLWTGSVQRLGYGMWSYMAGKAKVTVMAYRFSYELADGPVPDGLELDHLCRTPRCVRPSHLEPVTHAENMRRAMLFKQRPTHCPHGHEYTPENVMLRRNSAECRECIRLRSERARARKPPRPERTHCPNGHPFSPDNVYINGRGYRECRICRRDNMRAWQQRRKGLGDGGRDPRAD